MYARILVPIDGSDTAVQGLREAIALAQAQRDAQAAGVQTEPLLREMVSGRVDELIAEEAQARGCQLIVMGTHGRRGLSPPDRPAPAAAAPAIDGAQSASCFGL